MKPKVDPLLEYAEVAPDASGQASSPRYGDIYASRAGALGQARGVCLQGCGLLDTPARWAGCEQFTVLETGFGLGVNFLATWAAWRADPQRCARLDYVSLELHPVRAADLLLVRLRKVIEASRLLSIKYKDQVMVGRTHGIHGEPTTLGLKFAHFYAEMKRNEERLIEARRQVAVGKLSGAVGTFSNIEPALEEEVCRSLGLEPEPVATQVINRDRHAFYLSVLGVIAGGLDRMADRKSTRLNSSHT